MNLDEARLIVDQLDDYDPLGPPSDVINAAQTLLVELDRRGAAIERVRELVDRRRADDDGRGPAAVSVAELLRALDM
jgi:hypothetical protein